MNPVGAPSTDGTAGALARPRILVIACGAIARELAVAVAGWADVMDVTIERLPPTLHDTPALIPGRVRDRVAQARSRDAYDQILVGFADCGTGGLLDNVCAEEGIDRLPGAHCYELFAGGEAFAALHDEAPGTFYLTDYLVRCFERLVVENLGLDRHPELRAVYFANYTRVVYLAQRDDAALVDAAERAAQRLGLPLELHRTGFGHLAGSLAGSLGGSVTASLTGSPTGEQGRPRLPVRAA